MEHHEIGSQLKPRYCPTASGLPSLRYCPRASERGTVNPDSPLVAPVLPEGIRTIPTPVLPEGIRMGQQKTRSRRAPFLNRVKLEHAGLDTTWFIDVTTPSIPEAKIPPRRIPNESGSTDASADSL